jgi:hypothetical protein
VLHLHASCVLLCPDGSLAWASDRAGPAGSIPARTSWSRPSPKKLSLGLGPSCLNPLYFSPFYFDIWLKKSPYLISNIRKFQKKLWILLNLFIGSSYFFRIFHCIFDLWIFTVKCKFGIWYIFFSFVLSF